MILSDDEIHNLCKPTEDFYLHVQGNKKTLIDQATAELFYSNLKVYDTLELVDPNDTERIVDYLQRIPSSEVRDHGLFEPLISEYSATLVNEVHEEHALFTNRKRVISFGQSSFGYDLRIGNKFKIFTNVASAVVDPKDFDPHSFVEFEGNVCIIPPNSFVLAYSLERLVLPSYLTGVVLGKSTYARAGLSCICTPLEAGWCGNVTLEFSNTTPLPVMLYANEGACQVLFHRGRICRTSYADRSGKYQNQIAEPVLPKL